MAAFIVNQEFLVKRYHPDRITREKTEMGPVYRMMWYADDGKHVKLIVWNNYGNFGVNSTLFAEIHDGHDVELLELMTGTRDEVLDAIDSVLRGVSHYVVDDYAIDYFE